MDRDTVEEIKRHFGVVIEDTNSRIAAVAQGQLLLTERVDGLAAKVEEQGRNLEAFRIEVRKEFDETRAMIRLSYGELERRIVDLETGMADLRTRMERVETRLS